MGKRSKHLNQNYLLPFDFNRVPQTIGSVLRAGSSVRIGPPRPSQSIKNQADAAISPSTYAWSLLRMEGVVPNNGAAGGINGAVSLDARVHPDIVQPENVQQMDEYVTCK
jgi:hypothetical protein